MSRGVRNFHLVDSTGQNAGPVYTGSSPYQAGLKAAARGYKDIMLRESYSDKIHVYRGSRRAMKQHEHTPYTLRNGIATKPTLKKVGTL